jgi:hypothetical protein
LAAQLKTLNGNIAANTANQKRWSDNVAVFIDYMKRRELLAGANLQLVTSVSDGASKDQQAVADTYSSCLRLCKQDDPSCKSRCDDKATKSDPSKRMLHCDDVVTSFK